MAKFFEKYKSYIFLALIVLLSLKVFVPQLDGLKDGLAALKDADLSWVLVSLLIYFCGIPILTLQFMALAFKRLQLFLTYKVEMSTLFVSKLLPIGVGTASLNAYYLTKQKHSPSEAITVVVTNSMTSGVAYSFIMLLAFLSSPIKLEGLENTSEIPLNLILFLFIILISGIYFLLRSSKIKSKLKGSWSGIKKNLRNYKNRPRSLFYAVICNFFGSMTSILAIYGSAHAIGVDLSVSSAVVAYTFGNIAATIVPTPGGLGATEAGLYSGLVLTGVDGPNAIIITLIYRLITYWLPILPGYYFFHGLRKNILSDFTIKKNSVTSLAKEN